MLGLLSAVFLFACLSSQSSAFSDDKEPAMMEGPLCIHSHNPRYFTDESGKAIYLTGSHTWSVFQDSGPGNPPAPFDYPGFLSFLTKNHHNFCRLWVWEHSWGARQGKQSFIYPLPYLRVGPGTALDGQPKFDLTEFNPEYFNRLRSRVIMARDQGIYLAVMLFQGWSIENKTNGTDDPWPGHPFNAAPHDRFHQKRGKDPPQAASCRNDVSMGQGQ